MAIQEGDLLWKPTPEFAAESRMAHYMRWLAQNRGLKFAGYHALWQWSVDHLEDFWASMADYFEVKFHAPPRAVLGNRGMPGAQWFPGSTLNFAEHVFRDRRPGDEAIVFWTETTVDGGHIAAMVDGVPGMGSRTLTWAELEQQVAAMAHSLRGLGVGIGDRVVAYLPNMPEAVIAFLACASIGAIWSSCSPDIGASAVIDRFKQIEPKVIFCIDGYVYNGKPNDRGDVVQQLCRALPTLQHIVHVPYLRAAPTLLPDGYSIQQHVWAQLVSGNANLADLVTAVPFEHPLWVLYSSGTTGLPKPITHSQGGMLMEHLKSQALHCNLGPGDRFFWFSTTGWMMWNYVVGSLLHGCTIVLFDGSPGLNNMAVLWSLAECARVTMFGTSAAFITACIKSGIAPAETHDLSALVSIGSTGSPLSTAGFDWIYGKVKRDVWLVSLSGGTDVCDAFVGGCPLLPVHAGEIQCRNLGCDIHAWTEDGKPVIDDVGELVLTRPMPSMPIYFWNDPGMARYRDSYFDMFPGVWRHGDWVKITPRGSLVIYGRSDSTINRQGVRIGTSEIYRAVESVPEVVDSLIIDLEVLNRPSFMPLFVVLRPGFNLDDALKSRINQTIRAALSARQIPDAIYQIDGVPKTLNGKKMEIPVKKLLLGAPLEKAITPGSMANPEAVDFFVNFRLSHKYNLSL